ncbi:MAG: hypothetical protein ACUVQ8_06710 [Nitrososphaeria archaeon]
MKNFGSSTSELVLFPRRRWFRDLGSEKRTIITGIADQHHPSELVGKKMLSVTNLASKKIFGIKSKGMLLLAEDDKKRTYPIFADNSVPVGAKFY